MNKKLEELLEKLDEKAMNDEMTQYDEGVRDLLIALQGGDEEAFATEYLSEM